MGGGGNTECIPNTDRGVFLGIAVSMATDSSHRVIMGKIL